MLLPEWKKQSFCSFGPKVDHSKQKILIYNFHDSLNKIIERNGVFILVGET